MKILPSNIYQSILRQSLPLFFSFFCLVSSATFAQEGSETRVIPEYQSDSAEAWLVKMAAAIKTLNYNISFVLLKPGVDSQPYLWRHAVSADGVEMEQLDLLNGPGRAILRIGDKVSYFEPDFPPYSLRSSTINGPFPSEFFQYPQKLTDSYEFVMVGRSRVSGRSAQQIRVVSKDKSRFGLNIWLDQETGLLLKMNMVDLKGEFIEQIQVTGLRVTEEADPFFAKIEQAMLPDVIKMRPKTSIESKWRINYLPVGMRQVKLDVHRLPLTGETVEYIMLSDGLVDVSIYIHDVSAQTPPQNVLIRYESDTLLTLRQGNIDVTVVGKLPAKTANSIVTSIESVN